jgi:hypothetical protein
MTRRKGAIIRHQIDRDYHCGVEIIVPELGLGRQLRPPLADGANSPLIAASYRRVKKTDASSSSPFSRHFSNLP